MELFVDLSALPQSNLLSVVPPTSFTGGMGSNATTPSCPHHRDNGMSGVVGKSSPNCGERKIITRLATHTTKHSYRSKLKVTWEIIFRTIVYQLSFLSRFSPIYILLIWHAFVGSAPLSLGHGEENKGLYTNVKICKTPGHSGQLVVVIESSGSTPTLDWVEQTKYISFKTEQILKLHRKRIGGIDYHRRIAIKIVDYRIPFDTTNFHLVQFYLSYKLPC
jgi:hypothetical protein